MISKKTSLIILTCIIILINFYVINYYPIYMLPLRFSSSLIFLLVCLLFGGLIKIKLIMGLLFLCLTDFLIINYDDNFYNNLTTIPKSIAYIFIGWHLLPKFEVERENKKTLLVFLVLIGFCGIMFYELVDAMTFTFKGGVLHKYLYLCYALVLLSVLVLVGNYNFRYNSIQSISCMLFMFAFAISDLFAFIAYYLDINSFYYPTRLFYILGLGLFTAYIVLQFPKEELFIEDRIEV